MKAQHGKYSTDAILLSSHDTACLHNSQIEQDASSENDSCLTSTYDHNILTSSSVVRDAVAKLLYLRIM